MAPPSIAISCCCGHELVLAGHVETTHELKGIPAGGHETVLWPPPPTRSATQSCIDTSAAPTAAPSVNGTNLERTRNESGHDTCAVQPFNFSTRTQEHPGRWPRDGLVIFTFLIPISSGGVLIPLYELGLHINTTPKILFLFGSTQQIFYFWAKWAGPRGARVVAGGRETT